MKKLLTLTLACLIAGSAAASAQTLTGFGSSDVNPFQTSSDFLGSWTGTVNTTSMTVSNVSNNAGGIFDTLQNSVAVSNINTKFLTLTGALIVNLPTQPAPTVPNFSITVYDASLNDTMTYEFLWTTYAAGDTTFTGVLDPTLNQGTFTGNVAAFELDPGGGPGDVVSYRFDDLSYTSVFVPEPSTYAMLIAGLGALFFFGRRRKTLKVAKVRA